MSLPLYQVDAFTDTAFSGNPAAVCLLSSPRPDAWMQNVAAEMNLSETAFLRPLSEDNYQLRWFTPTDEVDLCGHATLASAHVLWSDGRRAPDGLLRFETASGTLSATRNDEWIALDFPTDPPSPIDATPASLLDGLGGANPSYVGHTGRDYLVRLHTAEAVRTLSPRMARLGTLDGRWVIVTAPADADEAVFVSRFFAPGVGVPEDPVTGSAHCALGPYWAAETGRTTLTGHQVSPRGGTVRMRLDAPEAERLTLEGQAVTVFHGRLDA